MILYKIKETIFDRSSQGRITLLSLDGWWEIIHCPQLGLGAEWRVRQYRRENGHVVWTRLMGSLQEAEDFVANERLKEILPLLDEVVIK